MDRSAPEDSGTDPNVMPGRFSYGSSKVGPAYFSQRVLRKE
jgi:hypothetical protein